jgi:AcrR family transcriptional regulator
MQIRNPELTKHNILLAAEDEFAQFGLHGARINSIAEKSGVNKRMIYHYYGSKEKVYESVLEHNFKKLARMGRQELFSEEDEETAIRKIITRYYHFLEENPKFVKIIAWEEVLTTSHNKKTLFETLAPAFRQVYDFYQRGSESGIFRENVDLAQLIISTHAMSLISFTQWDILSGIDPENTREKRLNHICEIVLRVIKTA